MSTLDSGVFGAAGTARDHLELRDLVEDLGRRSHEAGLGRRGVPEQFDAELWRHLEVTGLSRLTSTPETEAGPAELAVVLYELARHAAAVPSAETDVLAGWLGRAAGLHLPDGPLTVAVANADTDSGRVTGTARDVPWARACTTVLAIRSQVGLRVGVLDAMSRTLHESHNLAGEPRDAVSFDVPAAALQPADPALEAELGRRGAWSRCIQILGALDVAAALTVEHTRQRVQFGRSLSAFQSVQQALAQMAGEVERARAAVELAVGAAAEYGFASTRTDFAVTVAKVAVGRAVGPVTTAAHQLHGAIGVTREHPLWLFTLRAQSWTGDFGTTKHFARRLGRLAFTAEDPWELLTGDLPQLDDKLMTREST